MKQAEDNEICIDYNRNGKEVNGIYTVRTKSDSLRTRAESQMNVIGDDDVRTRLEERITELESKIVSMSEVIESLNGNRYIHYHLGGLLLFVIITVVIMGVVLAVHQHAHYD